MNGWVGIGVVLAALVGCLAALQPLSKVLPPEVRRKILHVAMGAVSLSFPFLFDAAWMVAAICGAATALFCAMRRLRRLKAALGGALYDVERSSASWGEVYYAAAICLLFALTRGEPVFYVIPVLILALGDAAAALIGVSYGRFRYETWRGGKSWEGSVAFFFVAYWATHTPLLLMTSIGRTESVLIGTLIAWLCAMVEGFAWNGIDNLILPLGAWLLLQHLTPLPTESLLTLLLVLAGLTLLALAWSRRLALRADGFMAAIVSGMLFWMIGGPRCLLPALVVFVAPPLLSPVSLQDRQALRGDARLLICIVSTSLAWATALKTTWGEQAYYAFVLGLAAHLLMILLQRGKQTGVVSAAGWTLCVWGMAVAACWADRSFGFGRGTATESSLSDSGALAAGAAALPVLALAATLYLRWGAQPNIAAALPRQAAIALGASSLAIGLTGLFS